MIFGGSAAAVVPGTILVVLADEQRVSSLHVRARHDDEWISDIDAAADRVRQGMPRPWTPIDSFKTMDIVLATHGVSLGVRAKDLQQGTLNNILGGLFFGIAPNFRHELIRGVAECVAEGICPVMVGLLASRTKALGVWPLAMLLARYAADGNQVVRRGH
jgi:hypothetical protein